MAANDQLAKLYRELDIVALVDNFNHTLTEEDYENEGGVYPLLLKSYEEYEKADVKIMLFGQETNGWQSAEPKDDIDTLMKLYEGFLDKGAVPGYQTSFFITVGKLMNMIRNALNGKSVRYLWNNIVKVGKGYAGFPEKLYNGLIKEKINHVIPKEVEILKPDFILFFSGPNYDHVIDDVFGAPEKKEARGFTDRQLCEIVLPNVKKAFRTYHPNYLRRLARDEYDRYLQKIAGEIISAVKN